MDSTDGCTQNAHTENGAFMGIHTLCCMEHSILSKFPWLTQPCKQLRKRRNGCVCIFQPKKGTFIKIGPESRCTVQKRIKVHISVVAVIETVHKTWLWGDGYLIEKGADCQFCNAGSIPFLQGLFQYLFCLSL